MRNNLRLFESEQEQSTRNYFAKNSNNLDHFFLIVTVACISKFSSVYNAFISNYHQVLPLYVSY